LAGTSSRTTGRESLWLEGGTKGVMSSLGFHPTIA
jgi:hypothetical protein